MGIEEGWKIDMMRFLSWYTMLHSMGGGFLFLFLFLAVKKGVAHQCLPRESEPCLQCMKYMKYMKHMKHEIYEIYDIRKGKLGAR